VDGGSGHVPIDAIVPNPAQPREAFDPARLEELAQSIRQHGVLQPLLVTRQSDGAYVLVAGERRWRAARAAGLDRVPVIIKDAADSDLLELALVENIQREDLSPLETALAYQQLVVEHGMTQEAVAQRIGKSRVAVANSLRLLNLPADARHALAGGQISEGHARALLACPSPESQSALLQQIVGRGLSVRDSEELARRFVDDDREIHGRLPRTKRSTAGRPVADLEAIESELREALGTKVQLIRGRHGGRLVIHFYSDDELEGLLERIRP
jgi:ParB family chromosome partitioning protein